MIITRAAIVLLATVTCAWFALGARQAHDIARATSIVSQPPPLGHAQARRAAALLRSAGTLDPDLAVDVLRGRLASAQGHEAQARQILFGVIQREPKYLDAWVWYARASTDSPVAFFAAQIGIRRLIRTFPARR